jgi:hypothetical protein
MPALKSIARFMLPK